MTSRRWITSLIAVLFVAAGLVRGSAPSAARVAEKDLVANHFLVDLRKGVDPVKFAKRIAAQYDGKATLVYDKVLGGFAFEGSTKAARRLAKDRRVESIEQDRVVRLADAPAGNVNHLSRDRVYDAYSAGYTGAGITIAVLDTGVNPDHEVFQAHQNVLPGHGRCARGSWKDRNGHGTASASNAVGRIGVAHEAKVIPVKVFPGASLATTWSRVVCGLNYVRQNASEIDIVNMSIAGSGSRSLKKTVRQLVSAGITVVAAAGNNGGGTQAPAKYPGVIAASALASGDRMAPFSATGQVTAPGVGIFSADKAGFSNRDGTSRSAPQVAGGAAIILALDPSAHVLDVLRRSGSCPDGSTAGGSGSCSGRWRGDDATAEPQLNVYCAGVLADPVRVDLAACGF